MPHSSSEPIAIALGSNVGDRLSCLRAAIDGLAPYVKISLTSPVYETAAAYVTEQPSFLNAVIVGTTNLEPLPLLHAVKKLEREIGRKPTFRYGPRAIDIDLIFLGNRVMSTDELTIPHALMSERDFVLRPLADIVPEWKHPMIGKTVSEMLSLLPDNGMTSLGKLL